MYNWLFCVSCAVWGRVYPGCFDYGFGLSLKIISGQHTYRNILSCMYHTMRPFVWATGCREMKDISIFVASSTCVTAWSKTAGVSQHRTLLKILDFWAFQRVSMETRHTCNMSCNVIFRMSIYVSYIFIYLPFSNFISDEWARADWLIQFIQEVAHSWRVWVRPAWMRTVMIPGESLGLMEV